MQQYRPFRPAHAGGRPAGLALARFTASLASAHGLPPGDEATLQGFSVREFRAFWSHLVATCRDELGLEGPAEPACWALVCFSIRARAVSISLVPS